MRRKLLVSDGTRERELQLVGRIVVGRDPVCEISHDDSLLSRRHAEFMTAGSEVTVRDLGSRNGVFVNGTRAAEHVLEAGDIIQIGPLRARYVVDDAPAGIAPEEMDGERTAVIRKILGAASGEESHAIAGGIAIDDEDATRMVAAPRMPSPADRSHSAVDDDHDRTQFFSAPDSVSREFDRAPAASATGGLTAFVFVQVLVLAMAVIAASAVPVLMWRRSVDVAAGASIPLVWFLVPVAVALVGAYFVSTTIGRRVTRTVSAVERRSHF